MPIAREPGRGPGWWLPAVLTALLLAAGCDDDRHGPPPAPAPAPAEEDADSPGESGEDPASLTEGDEPPPGRAGAALLGEVDRQFAAMRKSSYTHATHVDEASGTFDYDCSGFVDYSLARSVPSALAALRNATSHRPLARDFVAFLSGLPGAGAGRWRHLAHVRDLRPGDIIAWLRPADSTSRNTGHVMVVRAPPVANPTASRAALVPIVDSTALPHRPGDSRSAANATGLGQGEVVLITDEAGAPIGFRWSRGAHSREHDTRIALGRVE